MVHLNSTGTSDVKVNKTYYGIKCLGVFQFSILPGKLVSITVFTLFSHDYFFCVFEKQHKRGVAWRGTTLRRLQRWCVKIWASLPRLSHSKHNSKCLPPLNVSLWPLESELQKIIYLLFCYIFLVVNTVYPALDTFCRQFFKWQKHFFFLLAAPQKEIYKDSNLQTIHHHLTC